MKKRVIAFLITTSMMSSSCLNVFAEIDVFSEAENQIANDEESIEESDSISFGEENLSEEDLTKTLENNIEDESANNIDLAVNKNIISEVETEKNENATDIEEKLNKAENNSPIQLMGIAASGTCGNNLTWMLDDDGVLTISGNGPMIDYDYSYSSPWRSNRDDIKKIIIENGVTTIGKNAFCNFKITSIEIPDSIDTIGDYAFWDCQSLTNVKLPNSIKKIGCEAFDGNGLVSIELPNSVTTIDDKAFSSCHSLTSITIPSSVTAIGNSVFSSCDSLTDINVDEQNKNYSSENGILFDKNKTTIIEMPTGSKITEYNIPSSVTTIGEYAFYACKNLKYIEIPSSVSVIGAYAFGACDNLEISEIPNGVKEIGKGAFSGYNYNAPNLLNITIPGSVISIGKDAFYGCYLTNVKISYGVETIGENAFYHCSLKKIEIPSSVTNIGKGAFEVYDKDRLVIYVAKDSYAENYAKENGFIYIYQDSGIINMGECGENLTWVLDENGVLTISGNGTMTEYGGSYYMPWRDNTDEIKTVIIEKGVTSICKDAFNGCGHVTSINIPETVESIGEQAFNACYYLQNVNIPYGISKISEGTFRGCNNLKKIDIPESVEIIEAGAFDSCSHLREITIPSKVTSIENRAFAYCGNLKYVTIKGKIKTIGDYAFNNCTSLEKINLPDSLTSIGYFAFGYCDGLDTLVIPKSVTSIGEYAFYTWRPEYDVFTVYCYKGSIADNKELYTGSYEISFKYLDDESAPDKEYAPLNEVAYEVEGGNIYFDIDTGEITDCDPTVTMVDIPEKIKGIPVIAIGKGAFLHSYSLKTINIPSTVKEIKAYGLSQCPVLEQINMESGIETVGDFAFYDDTVLTSLKLPYGLKTIGRGAFQYVGFHKETTNIDIVIPQTVKSLGESPLYYSCISSITFLGKDTEFTSLEHPLGTPKVYCYKDSFAEKFCIENNYTYELLEDNYGIVNYEVNGGNIYFDKTSGTITGGETSITEAIIPEYIDGVKVVAIADNAFMYFSELTKFELPNSITSIGEMAFANCKKLNEINIPSNVDTIEYGAFSNCDSLTQVIIPDNVKTIGNSAFSGCDNIKEVYISQNITTFNSVFGGCYSIEKLIIPENAKSIERQAFYGNKLKKLYILTDDATIDKYAFNKIMEDSDYDGLNIGCEVYCYKGSTADNVELYPDGIEIKYFEDENLIIYPVPNGYLYFDTLSGTITDCEVFDENVSIPNEINNVEVTTIDSNAFVNCKQLRTIYCAKGSVADNKALYPNDVEIAYNDNNYVFGDADGDNVITASDAAFVLQKTLISTFELPIQKKTDDWLKYTDVDADNNITASDAAFILQKTLISTFELPAEKKYK